MVLLLLFIDAEDSGVVVAMRSHQQDPKQNVSMAKSTMELETTPADNAAFPCCRNETEKAHSSQPQSAGNIDDDKSTKKEILRQLQHVNFKIIHGSSAAPSASVFGRAKQEILGGNMKHGEIGAFPVSAAPPAQLLQEEMALVRFLESDSRAMNERTVKEEWNLDAVDDRNIYIPANNGEELTEASRTDDTLTEAIPVNEVDSSFRPVAVEIDPDFKDADRRKQPATFNAVLITMIGLVVVLLLSGVIISLQKRNATASGTHEEDLPLRKFIQSYLLHVMDVDQTDEFLRVHSDSPYRKALDWISFHDPLQPSPDHPYFLQRYWSAYFYFATSAKSQWKNCNPPQEGDSTQCSYIFFDENFDDPLYTTSFTSPRWLSNATECKWAGITCDRLGQITEISLCRLPFFCF